MAEQPVSSVIINFPDCATLGSHDEEGTTDQGDTITVFTEGCPAAVPGPPPLIGTGEIVAMVLVALALIGGTAVVRFRAHERKEAERQAYLAAQVELAKAHKSCDTCGDKYEPELA